MGFRTLALFVCACGVILGCGLPQDGSATTASPVVDVARTPVVRDISTEMNQKPSLTLDLEHNLILGDPYNEVLPVMKTQSEALDACLVSLASTEGRGAPSAITVTISANGRLKNVNLMGSWEPAEQCLFAAMEKLDFGEGQERWGDVKIESSAPQTATRDPGVDELTWTTEAGGFSFAMTATRKFLESNRWGLEIQATATAIEQERGVGYSLRSNTKLVFADGASENSFSVQDSTTVTRCLAPGESETFVTTPMGNTGLSLGMRFEAPTYLLGGDCETGKGRWAVGTIHLDWTEGDRPLLYVTPP